MSNLIDAMFQLFRHRWWLPAAIASVFGVGAICLRVFEPEAARQRRTLARNRKELRALADKIATYARNIRQQFPDGTVVVSEHDLAEQLRRRPDSVVTALNVLLKEQRVQRTQLTGYWRLNA